MIYLIFAILIVGIFSALCSMVEAALFTVPINRVKAWLLSDDKESADHLYKIKESIQKPIATIVILNSISNVLGSMIIGGLIANLFDNIWVGIASALFTIFIILFSEVIPKTIGEKYADIISLKSAHTMIVLTRIFHPLLFFIMLFTKPIMKINRYSEISEEEIKVLANLGTKQGVLEKEEEAIIQKALKLNDIKVKDIMTPRMNMIGLNENLLLKDTKARLIKEKYSRIPLFKKNIDQITGLLYKVDALKAICENNLNIELLSLRHKVLFVPENKTIDKLMEKLRVTQTHTAIVIDEYGGTAGLVTLEDVLEELVGDIMSTDVMSSDREKASIKACISKDEVIVSGTTIIEEVNKYFATDIETYRTVSKLILEQLKRFPLAGEIIIFEDLEFIVEKVSSKTIETVRVRREKKER